MKGHVAIDAYREVWWRTPRGFYWRLCKPIWRALIRRGASVYDEKENQWLGI